MDADDDNALHAGDYLLSLLIPVFRGHRLRPPCLPLSCLPFLCLRPGPLLIGPFIPANSPLLLVYLCCYLLRKPFRVLFSSSIYTHIVRVRVRVHGTGGIA